MNKTLEEYHINENKRNTPLAYISNKNWEELVLVNPVNSERVENELRQVNRQLEIVANRPDVSQIVYNTMEYHMNQNDQA